MQFFPVIFLIKATHFLASGHIHKARICFNKNSSRCIKISPHDLRYLVILHLITGSRFVCEHVGKDARTVGEKQMGKPREISLHCNTTGNSCANREQVENQEIIYKHVKTVDT